MSHTLTIRLSTELATRLEILAQEHSVPRGTVIRQALEAWIETKTKTKAKGSGIMRFAGSISGPRESATNASVQAAYAKVKK